MTIKLIKSTYTIEAEHGYFYGFSFNYGKYWINFVINGLIITIQIKKGIKVFVSKNFYLKHGVSINKPIKIYYERLK